MKLDLIKLKLLFNEHAKTGGYLSVNDLSWDGVDTFKTIVTIDAEFDEQEFIKFVSDLRECIHA